MEYRIGDLAATVGLPVHVVRFYEKYGIVSPKRTGEGNYRTFEELDLRRLTLARHLRSFGFSLEQTAELLSSSTYAQQYEALDLRAHQITQELRRLERVRQSIYRELSDMDFAQETLTQCRLTRLPGMYWLFSHTEKRDFPSRQSDGGLTARVMGCVPSLRFLLLTRREELLSQGHFSYQWGEAFDEDQRDLLPPEDLPCLTYLPPRQYLAASTLVDDKCVITREMFSRQLAECRHRGLQAGDPVCAELQGRWFDGEGRPHAAVVCYLPVQEP